jgi:hypothetical protein
MTKRRQTNLACPRAAALVIVTLVLGGCGRGGLKLGVSGDAGAVDGAPPAGDARPASDRTQAPDDSAAEPAGGRDGRVDDDGGGTTDLAGSGHGDVLGLAVHPALLTLLSGEQRRMIATATFSDGAIVDVTTACSWSSDRADVATVDGQGMGAGLTTARGPGSTYVRATFMGESDSANVIVDVRKPVQLTLFPLTPMVVIGSVTRFMATATYSDGTIDDVTSQAVWVSSNQAVATVNNGGGGRNDPIRGEVVALALGSTVVSAQFMELAVSTTLIVGSSVLMELQISPAVRAMPTGLAQDLVATALYSDLSSRDVTRAVVWQSEDASVTTVSNDLATKGRVNAAAPGKATITARTDGVKASVILTVLDARVVGVELTPASISSPTDVSTPLRATALLSNGARYELGAAGIWTSADLSVLTLAASPLGRIVRPLAAGSTTVEVDAGGVIGRVSCEVRAMALDRVVVSPADAAVLAGKSLPFTALATYADGSSYDVTDQTLWRSSDPSVAVVGNADGGHGVATGLRPGLVTVEGRFAGQAGSARLSIDKD